MLLEIQHTFDMEIRNDSFAKHFKKIFKKKMKVPKLKSDDADGILINCIILLKCFYSFLQNNYLCFQFSITNLIC